MGPPLWAGGVCLCVSLEEGGAGVLAMVEQCQSCKTICNNLLYCFKGERTDAKSISWGFINIQKCGIQYWPKK